MAGSADGGSDTAAVRIVIKEVRAKNELAHFAEKTQKPG